MITATETGLAVDRVLKSTTTELEELAFLAHGMLVCHARHASDQRLDPDAIR